MTVIDLELAPAPPQERRRTRSALPEDRFAVLGSAAAALSLTWLLSSVLLPFSGVLGFLVLAFGLFVALYASVSAFTLPGTHVRDRVVSVVVHGLALTLFSALVVVVVFTFRRGASALLHLSFLTDDLADTGPLQPLTEGGVLHAVLGTLVMISLALVLSVPAGLLAALYLSEARSRFATFVRSIVEAMTALPSVIAGLAVYALVIAAQRSLGIGEKSGLAASCALAIMMLPIIIRAADVVLRLVPGNLKEAAAALGAPRWRVVRDVVLPTSRSGLMTAVILGTARGIGETSPVLLTAGYTTGFNLNPFSGPMVSLPLATFSLTRSPEPTQIARGFGAAAVLLVLVLVLFVLARVVGGRAPGDLSRRGRRRAAARSAADRARFDEPLPSPPRNGPPS